MELTPLDKANILVEALPYIKEFYGKTVVIKYGGSAMTDCSLKEAVIQDIVLMKFVGMNPVVVHGGGPEISNMLKKIGKKTSFINGLRVTDGETMEIVEMVLVGKINKDIVARINQCGGKGIGLSGKDGQLLEAVKKSVVGCNETGEKVEHDLGQVGKVKKVNTDILHTVIKEDYIPVVAPVGAGPRNEDYNINADDVAGAIAVSLGADKLVLLTDVPGILAREGDDTSLISALKVEDVSRLIEKGVISGGMIPKVLCCKEAVLKGVARTHIVDGRVPHSMLLEIFTDKGVGSMVVK